jgi:hypothetical protein
MFLENKKDWGWRKMSDASSLSGDSSDGNNEANQDLFWSHLCTTMTRSLGTTREIWRSFWGFLAGAGSTYRKYYFEFNFFDLDLALLQFACLS